MSQTNSSFSPAPPDEFLAEIQTHLVSSLGHRLREFSAEQSAHFPSVADLGEITHQLWEDLAKDFEKSELPDWSTHFHEIKDSLAASAFQNLWQSCRAEIKVKFWDFCIDYLQTLGQQFKAGQKTAFKNSDFFLSGLQNCQSETPNSEIASAQANIDDRLFLKCKIRGHHFLVPVKRIVEIQQVKKLTPLPVAHPRVSGLLSSRGEMFPIFSLAELGSSVETPPAFLYFVICEERGHKFGFAVDNTDQVITIDRDHLQPASIGFGLPGAIYIQHSLLVDQQIHLVIEPEKIVA